MEVCTEILGNLHDPQWKSRINELDVEYIPLDQWTAQKSRFLAKSERGTEYPVALKRQSQVVDGDIIFYDAENRHVAALKLELNPVLVMDLSTLVTDSPEAIIRRALELGHAIGNQHWPAVVKGTKIYVPLTVDKKVMLSVMDTHHLEGVEYEFQEGREVIPYMAPHEIRRLFGGASHGSHVHGGIPHEHHHHDDQDAAHGDSHGEKGHKHSHGCEKDAKGHHHHSHAEESECGKHRHGHGCHGEGHGEGCGHAKETPGGHKRQDGAHAHHKHTDGHHH